MVYTVHLIYNSKSYKLDEISLQACLFQLSLGVNHGKRQPVAPGENSASTGEAKTADWGENSASTGEAKTADRGSEYAKRLLKRSYLKEGEGCTTFFINYFVNISIKMEFYFQTE